MLTMDEVVVVRDAGGRNGERLHLNRRLKKGDTENAIARGTEQLNSLKGIAKI